MDRDGNLLADSVQVKAVYADPTLVADPARTATALSGPLGVPADQLADKIRHPTSNHFVYLAHGVDPHAGRPSFLRPRCRGLDATGRWEALASCAGGLAHCRAK